MPDINLSFLYRDERYYSKKTKQSYTQNHTPLEAALENGHYEVAKFLIERGAATGSLSRTEFIDQLTIDGDVRCVKLCLERSIIKPEDLPKKWQAALADPILSEKQLYQEVGGGKNRWQFVFGQTPPHKGLINLSPFGFDIDRYNEFLPITQVITHMEQATRMTTIAGGHNVMLTVSEDKLAAEHAYKLSVLFGDMRSARKFIDQFQNAESKQPIHDLLLFTLPKNGQWSIPAWRGLVLDQRHGLAMTKLLTFAPQIEKALGRPPRDYEEAKITAAQVSYERAGENIEFAKMCVDHFIEEEAVNRALDTRIKATSNLPDISIDGAAVGVPGYKMVKLPVGDMRGFLLGKLTNCCQSIGGQGEACARHLMASPDADAYIIVQERKGKPDRIVAQSFVGISEDGKTLIMDSWERLGESTDRLLDKFYPAFAFEAQKHGLEVTLGTGGNTPTETGYTAVIAPKKMRGYNDYNDSTNQVTIPPRPIAAVGVSVEVKSTEDKEKRVDPTGQTASPRSLVVADIAVVLPRAEERIGANIAEAIATKGPTNPDVEAQTKETSASKSGGSGAQGTLAPLQHGAPGHVIPRFGNKSDPGMGGV